MGRSLFVVNCLLISHVDTFISKGVQLLYSPCYICTMARPRRIRHKKTPEVVIAEAIVTETVSATMAYPYELPAGKRIKIARVINTPIGLRFRQFETTRWIPAANLRCDFDKDLIVDYVKIANENRKRLASQDGGDKIPKGCKPVKASVKTTHVSRKRRGKQGRTSKAMDKQLLKNAIVALTTGDRVSVTFLSSMPAGESNTRYDGIRGFAGQTVEATLVQTKKGRGKGGSQLMVLKTEDGTTFTTGTPHSDVVLNLTTPAGKIGHESEADVPRTFEPNAGRAGELKESFKSLVGTVGATVQVQSTEDEFTGSFTVTEAEQLRGRHGQVRLTLTQGDRSVKVWSYRHSGVISSFEVTSQGTVPTAETSETA